MNVANSPTSAKLSPLERVLRIFSDVRSGEGITAVLMILNIYLLLGAYYILKTLRESEILSSGMFGMSGAELKAYATPGQALLFLGIIPLYGILASKVNRIRLINITTLFFIGCLVAFFVFAGILQVSISLIYFIWVGIFNMFVIAQFWSYANDVYTKDQGNRLFPVVAVGGSLGAVTGSFVPGAASKYPYELMLASAGVLGLCMLLYNVVNRLEHSRLLLRAADKKDADESEKPLSDEGGFQLIFRNRYLLLIAMLILLTNFVNTTGGYLFDDRVEQYAIEVVPDSSEEVVVQDGETREDAVKKERGAVISGVYGTFYGTVNIASMLIQMFLVSRIFKYLGLRIALFILPFIVIGGYAIIALLPTLAVVRAAKVFENSTDYSLQNTVRHTLFLPTSREAKYKAKAAIDTFFVRFGDLGAAAVIFAGINWWQFSTREYALVCLVVSVLALMCVIGIARLHREMVPNDKAGAEDDA